MYLRQTACIYKMQVSIAATRYKRTINYAFWLTSIAVGILSLRFPYGCTRTRISSGLLQLSVKFAGEVQLDGNAGCSMCWRFSTACRVDPAHSRHKFAHVQYMNSISGDEITLCVGSIITSGGCNDKT